MISPFYVFFSLNFKGFDGLSLLSIYLYHEHPLFSNLTFSNLPSHYPSMSSLVVLLDVFQPPPCGARLPQSPSSRLLTWPNHLSLHLLISQSSCCNPHHLATSPWMKSGFYSSLDAKIEYVVGRMSIFEIVTLKWPFCVSKSMMLIVFSCFFCIWILLFPPKMWIFRVSVAYSVHFEF